VGCFARGMGQRRPRIQRTHQAACLGEELLITGAPESFPPARRSSLFSIAVCWMGLEPRHSDKGTAAEKIWRGRQTTTFEYSKFPSSNWN
jgi:hypothetical protein